MPLLYRTAIFPDVVGGGWSALSENGDPLAPRHAAGRDRTGEPIRLAPSLCYRLVEFRSDGTRSAERFPAPDDGEALARAFDVAQGATAELWRGADLILRWRVTSKG